MTLEQYKNLIKEFSLYYYDDSYYDDSSSEFQYGLNYGPDGCLDKEHTESVCGWRRNKRVFDNSDKSWKANSLIMYEHGCWNGKYAATVKAGRKLLNEFFRGRKLKEIEQRKIEIKKVREDYDC